MAQTLLSKEFGHNKAFYLDYISGNFGVISEREMARKLKIGKTTVNRYRKELGIEIKKNTVNEHFFKKFTREMSYILGFVFTDGNVSYKPEESRWTLTITQSEKDFSHLERIRNILGSSKELLYSPKTKSYRLTVANRIICEDLIKLGVIPRKSLVVDFPDIPKEVLPDFIRGVIDGDGSISYFDRKRSPYFRIIIFSGSKKFLDKLENAVKNSIGVSSRVRTHHKNTFSLPYTCKRASVLADWIYKDTNLYLGRKYINYEKCLERGH